MCLVFQELKKLEIIFPKFQIDLLRCKKQFWERWEQPKWIKSYCNKTSKKFIFQFFKVFCMFQRLIQSKNDFFFIPNGHKNVQKIFSRKMVAIRMFYNRRFFSYFKKTAKKLIFCPFSKVILNFRGSSIAKMIFS